jgi:aminoglycoside 6'-N-acetyltransferase
MSNPSFVQLNDIAIRRMRDDDEDHALMAKWLSDERVLEFYEGRDRPHDIEAICQKYDLRALGEGRVVLCILIYEGQPIGYIQFYPVSEHEAPEYGIQSIEGIYGVDLFIGEPAYWNRGIGTRALSALLKYLFNEAGALWVVIDPQVTNYRAIRSYEKCGFKKVKILPRHELHEGEYHDCWLMVAEQYKAQVQDK